MEVSSWRSFLVSKSAISAMFHMLCFILDLIVNIFTGVGTRDYYRKLGYELDGPYMSKSLL